MRVPILAAGSLPAQIIRIPALERIPGFCCVIRLSGRGGSTADSESSASELPGPAAGPVDGSSAGPAGDEHGRWTPAEPLRPYVAASPGSRQRGLPPARHRGLPSPYLTLIFTLDEPLTIEVHPDPGQPPGEFGTLLGGLHSVPALITHAGGPASWWPRARAARGRCSACRPGRSPPSTCRRRPSSAASAPNCATGSGPRPAGRNGSRCWTRSCSAGLASAGLASAVLASAVLASAVLASAGPARAPASRRRSA